MDSGVRIGELMTVAPRSVGIDQPIKLAKSIMRDHDIRHLPVQRGGLLVGVISEGDVNLALSFDDRLSVEDVVVAEPYEVSPRALLKDVAARMSRDRIACALVTDDGKLCGIYTATDACRDLARVLGETSGSPAYFEGCP